MALGQFWGETGGVGLGGPDISLQLPHHHLLRAGPTLGVKITQQLLPLLQQWNQSSTASSSARWTCAAAGL